MSNAERQRQWRERQKTQRASRNEDLIAWLAPIVHQLNEAAAGAPGTISNGAITVLAAKLRNGLAERLFENLDKPDARREADRLIRSEVKKSKPKT